MTISNGSTVLLTGVTGFLAKHVMLALLDAGFQVRGTMRSLSKADAVRAVAEKAGHDPARLTFVAADLGADAGWAEAAQGCAAVIHTASPFPLDNLKDRMALVGPARDGTLRVLSAAKAAGIKRIVLTSSVAAIMDGHGDPKGRVFSEADWTNDANEEVKAYPLSKTLAERAAWDFVNADPGMEMAVINPSFILGPLLDDDAGSSADVITMFLKGKYPGVPDLQFGVVDVRDVALAHVKAMVEPAAAGGRHICNAGMMTMQDIAKALRGTVPERAGKLPKFVLPKFALRIAALFDPAIAMILPQVGQRLDFDNGRARNVLGITFRPAEEAVGAMGKSLIRLGLA